MGAKIIHDQMNRSSLPVSQHDFLPELPTGFGILMRGSLADRFSCSWAKSPEPLQGSIARISIWSASRPLAPLLSPPWDRLQGSQLIETNNDSPLGRMTIEVYDSVFFTSKSGSWLSHQVCPVRKRRPCRVRIRRIVSRLRDFNGECCRR